MCSFENDWFISGASGTSGTVKILSRLTRRSTFGFFRNRWCWKPCFHIHRIADLLDRLIIPWQGIASVRDRHRSGISKLHTTTGRLGDGNKRTRISFPGAPSHTRPWSGYHPTHSTLHTRRLDFHPWRVCDGEYIQAPPVLPGRSKTKAEKESVDPTRVRGQDRELYTSTRTATSAGSRKQSITIPTAGSAAGSLSAGIVSVFCCPTAGFGCRRCGDHMFRICDCESGQSK